MSTELMEKVIQTSSIGNGTGGGGLLAPEQASRFIDYMWDATVLGSQIRQVPMRGNEIEVNRIGVGTRLVRLATEAVDDGLNVGVAFSKVSISTEKFRLDWELSSEALEDNIEGAALEDHIARLMATQAGEDLEYLAINGNRADSKDPLLKGFDGWSALGNANGHIVDAAGETLSRALLQKTTARMPRQLMQNRAGLKLFTGPGAIQNYQASLEQAAFGGNGYVTPQMAAAIDNGLAPSAAGWSVPGVNGYNLYEVPLFREDKKLNESGATAGTGSAVHTEVWFTDPKNLLWGVKREIKVLSEYINKKDTIEYTMFTRIGAAVENTDAFVVLKNVKVN